MTSTRTTPETALDLDVRGEYVLHVEVPLMPTTEWVKPTGSSPEEVAGSLAPVARLALDTEIVVLSIKMKRGKPWYRVRVVATGRQGWINSAALLRSE